MENPKTHAETEGQVTSGVTAQEIEKVMPELVITANDENKSKSVNYNALSAYFIEAIKAQQKTIDILYQKMNSLAKKLESLKTK